MVHKLKIQSKCRDLSVIVIAKSKETRIVHSQFLDPITHVYLFLWFVTVCNELHFCYCIHTIVKNCIKDLVEKVFSSDIGTSDLIKLFTSYFIGVNRNLRVLIRVFI